MSGGITLTMHWSDWLTLLGHFLSISLLAVGGALGTLPEMHRFLVDRQHWLTDPQFNASVAIAQAAPGPNVLFVALMGWNIGINTGSYAAAVLGAAICMIGLLLPSGTLAYLAARWGHRNRERRAVRAFKLGMSPVVISLLIGTGWILASVHNDPVRDWALWLTTAVTALIVWRTKIHLLWLIAAGAIFGAMGWI